ncbi:EamA-like transporter family protein [Anaerohalosphaera lusitana]|uniref:EamA-like transporter family protein n=1 Tax=Anaerohalosphaera lusitana TaxID=1936003 RepID=A0A1U9NII8_9BACT|nr:EamA-like transporter family protein [Anaerohalosphaera lusitana]
MISLLLKILSSVAVAMILKLQAQRRGSRTILIASNYIVASLINFVLWQIKGFEPLSLSATSLAAITGVSYFVAFTLMISSIASVGAALTVAVSRLAIILPMVTSIFFYREIPTAIQIAGITLAAVAMYFFSQARPSNGSASKYVTLREGTILTLLFVCMGINAVSFKIFKENFGDFQMEGFITILFAVAAVFAWTYALAKKEEFRLSDIGLGLTLGIPNGLSSLFLMLALLSLPGIVVFPVNHAGVISLSAVAAILIFREKICRSTLIGILVAIAAIVLMTFQPKQQNAEPPAEPAPASTPDTPVSDPYNDPSPVRADRVRRIRPVYDMHWVRPARISPPAHRARQATVRPWYN